MKRPALADLPERFDLVVIGGGITGAGIVREAVQTGAKVLLIEQGDFASGTSSRSSKLVHGGLRYLKTGQWSLTLESVRERQRLLREAEGLVVRQPFVLPLYRGRRPGPLAIRTGLWIYDRMAGTRGSRWLDPAEAAAVQPGLGGAGLLGAMAYEDAQTDDARLVLRLLFESVAEGAMALNYARAADLPLAAGRVTGVTVEDALNGERRSIESGMVINATGAWAARLGAPGAPPLRPLRGSHLLFPLAKLPVTRAVSWMHPQDGRPVFAYPWQGVALCGTTDLDHGDARLEHPAITRDEAAYLVEALRLPFPDLPLSAADAVASYAGVRPVVAGGQADPSAESRESALWSSPGLVGVTGGKLTTFRVTARQALATAARELPALAPRRGARVFAPVPDGAPAPAPALRGRFGAATAAFERERDAAGDEPIEGTPYGWAELRWSARHELVVHLDDLLLRRTRLGLLLARGGEALLPRLRSLCEAELGWDAARWEHECIRYQDLWRREHAVPA